jgi:FkbM family methyltransferase
LPPYPPGTPEKYGRIKTVKFGINYHGKKVYITGWKFWETFLAIKEVFIEKEYDWLDVTGRKVLDLGAFTGDSAISFAMRGATDVYTCEPNPNMINIIQYNVKENGLQNKIKVLHCFVGGKVSKNTGFYFDDQNMVNRASDLKIHKIKSEVPTITLDQIVRECGIVDGCLKMDIEGSEYEVINATRLATLRKFRQMQIDFHKINGKSYKSIKKKLEKAGFDCKIQFVGTCEGGYIDALSTRT